MGSPRIKGNVKPTLTLGSPGVDVSVDLISYRIENEEGNSDTVTFEDAATGSGRQFYLRGSAVQSTEADSFHTYNWDNSGDTGVPYTLAVHGNAVATEDQPHYVGTLTIGPKPTIGGDASTSTTSAFQFDFEFEIDGIPTRDEGE